MFFCMSLKTVEWKDNSVIMIDQTKLPNILEYVTFTDFNQVADAIRTLVVRGAPAIGVSGAFGLALASLQSNATEKTELITFLENAKQILFETRPTAVNLGWGLEKIMQVANAANTVEEIRKNVVETAKKMAEEDIQINMAMGKTGSELGREAGRRRQFWPRFLEHRALFCGQKRGSNLRSAEKK